MAAQTGIPYRSPRRRAQWAVAVLALMVLPSAVSVAFDLAAEVEHLTEFSLGTA